MILAKWNSATNWRVTLDQIMANPKVEEHLQNEFFSFSEAIINIDKIIPERERKEYQFNLDFKEVLRKMIEYVHYGVINKANKDNMILLLKIFESILENS